MVIAPLTKKKDPTWTDERRSNGKWRTPIIGTDRHADAPTALGCRSVTDVGTPLYSNGEDRHGYAGGADANGAILRSWPPVGDRPQRSCTGAYGGLRKW